MSLDPHGSRKPDAAGPASPVLMGCSASDAGPAPDPHGHRKPSETGTSGRNGAEALTAPLPP